MFMKYQRFHCFIFFWGPESESESESESEEELLELELEDDEELLYDYDYSGFYLFSATLSFPA